MLGLSAFVIIIVVVTVSATTRYVDYRDLPRLRALRLHHRALPKLITEGEGVTGGETAGPSTTPAPAQCTSPRKFCDGCEKVLICDAYNNTIPVATCKYPQTCNAGACSSTPTPECSDIAKVPFKCNGEGVLPDPADCQSYHICLGDDQDQTKPVVDHKRNCQGLNKQAYGFNALTKVCDKKLLGNECGGFPVPLCTAPGTTGQLKDNNSCYYFCVEVDKVDSNQGTDKTIILYPMIYCCKNGGVYNPSNYSCSTK